MLSDVATVSSGMTVRQRLTPQPDGVLAIQMADLSGSGDLDLTLMSRVPFGHARYEVLPGDVLLRSRGKATTAWVVPFDLPEPAVAVMPLFIVRPRSDAYDPRYLAWWLNQPAAQAHLRKVAQGQTIQMVAKSALESVQLRLPTMEVQRSIAEAADLAEHEAELVHRLADAKRDLRQAQLTSAALAE